MSEKKKNKSNVTVSLPKARASVKRQKEMANMKATHDDTWKAIGFILAALVILFILLGGISQKGAWNVAKNWSKNVGEKVAEWFEGGDIVANEDGVYWDPSGKNPDGLKNKREAEEAQKEQEQKEDDKDNTTNNSPSSNKTDESNNSE